MHGVGEKCTNIYDPMLRLTEALKDQEKEAERTKKNLRLIRIRSHNEDPIDDLAPNLEAKQDKPGPTKKSGGLDGQSDDPLDSFLAAHLFKVTEDKVASIKDASGTTRYFRLLLITPDASVKIGGKSACPLGIGQELAPDGTLAPIPATLKSKFDNRHIILIAKDKTGADRSWHATTYYSFK